MNLATVYLSNQLEKLHEELKTHLFFEKNSPFQTPPLILTPTSAVEEWVRLRLAEDKKIGVVIGFTFLSLHTALENLVGHTPTLLELLLAIVAEMRLITEKENPLWEPLLSYLEKGDLKRRWSFAKQLAICFQKYALYGKELASWKKEPKNWQEALFVKVFQKWKIASEALASPITHLPEDSSLHLFGFSHLSAPHFHFFQKMGENYKVYIYQLSLCKEFWSDFRSDRAIERFFTKKKLSQEEKIQWEELLEERNPLLANLGMVGKEQAILLEDSNLPLIESYVEREEITLLSHIQKELLTLETVAEKELDDSIQFHVSTTPHREIENLYETLLSFTQKGIPPKDILVMAHSLTPYLPFIPAVFSNQIPFRMIDVPIAPQNPHMKGLLYLFSLNQKRWSAPAILELFSMPLFCKKMSWDADDLHLIRTWIMKTGIRWGLDLDHRNVLLSQKHCQKKTFDACGTWLQGIDALIGLLATGEGDKKLIHYSHSELLSDLWQLLLSLKEDLSPKTRSLLDWGAYFKTLEEKYFSFSDEREAFLADCDSLIFLHKNFSANLYCLQEALFLLEELLTKKSSSINPHQLGAVRFCPMLPMRMLPAKVVCLLGMNEESFPHKDSLQSLDLLKGKAPSSKDFGRYLLLEAIVSAREALIISYLSHSPQDHSEIRPSHLVEALFAAIGPHAEESKIVHPPFSLRPISQSVFLDKNLPTSQSPPLIAQWIDLADLKRFLQYPLRHYFHHTLHLFVRPEESLSEEEDFVLSPLHLAQTRLQLLQGMQLNARAEDAFFQKVSSLRLKSQEKNFLSLLEEQSIPKELVSSLELSPYRASAPLERVHQGTPLFFTGKIEGVLPDGLIAMEKKDPQGIVRALPTLIYLDALKKEPKWVLFARDGERKEIPAMPFHLLLEPLMEYYFKSFMEPSFLIPAWIPAILKKDPIKLKKAMESSLSDRFGKSYDHELLWMHQHHLLPSPEEIIEKEGEKAQKILGELFHAWL